MLANENPRSYPVQLALRAWRCERPAARTRRCRCSSAPRRSAPSATGDDSPHAQMAEIALEKKDRTRDRRAHGVPERRLRERRRRASAGVAAEGSRRHAIRPGSVPSTSASSPSTRSTRDAHGGARPDGAAAERRRRSPRREFRTVIALKPIDPAVAHTDLAESYLEGRQARRGEAPDARGARNRADATSARRICC